MASMNAPSSCLPSSGSPPKLDTSTLSLLDNFLDRKKKERALFEHLKARSSSTSTASKGTNNGDSSEPSSKASSISSRRRNKKQVTASPSRNVLDLLPRGRSGKGSQEQDAMEENEASLLAQAEALADLERLNGFKPSIPISTLRAEEGDDSGDSDEDEEGGDDSDAPAEKRPYRMDVDEFRRYFGERWQLSQFWYTSEFSYHLARCIYALMKSEPNESSITRPDHSRTLTTTRTTSTKDPAMKTKTNTKRIGFIACPTAYVAFQHLYPESLPDQMAAATDDDNALMDRRSNTNCARDEIQLECYLFDFDERFSLLTPPHHMLPMTSESDRFICYDLNKPLSLPPSLVKQLDMVIIDPPYLNAETNMNIAQSVERLLKSPLEEEGKVLLITGESIAEQACEIYGNARTGPLRRAEKLHVEHIDLKNDFGAWGNWIGVERFGVA